MSSPVPWIGDALWRAWNPGEVRDGECPVDAPELVEVSESDRQRAPLAEPSAPLAPTGTLEEQRARLLATPASYVRTHQPVWPLCCRRLCTLSNCQGTGTPLSELERHGALDHAYLEAEARALGRERAEQAFEASIAKALGELRRTGFCDGLNVFRCRACGRTYAASCHP